MLRLLQAEIVSTGLAWARRLRQRIIPNAFGQALARRVTMLKRNVIANYLGQGWRVLMSLAFVPLYIKYLGIEAYGLIGILA